MKTKKILWVFLAPMLLVLPACDNDDEPEVGPDSSKQKLTSMTVYGQSLASFNYDSQGRMTRIQVDETTIDISYSPLKMVVTDEDEVTEWSDIVTNQEGYITSAKLTEWYGGEIDSWTISINYNQDNYMVLAKDGDGSPTSLEWNGSRMVSLDMKDDDYTYSQTLSYTNTKNKAKNVSIMWCEMSLYWLTGLFGEVPGYLPSQLYDSDGDMTVNFGYKLNSNGSIAKEQVTFEGEAPVVIDYNYTASRASITDSTISAWTFDFNKNSSKKHKLFSKK